IRQRHAGARARAQAGTRRGRPQRPRTGSDIPRRTRAAAGPRCSAKVERKRRRLDQAVASRPKTRRPPFPAAFSASLVVAVVVVAFAATAAAFAARTARATVITARTAMAIAIAATMSTSAMTRTAITAIVAARCAVARFACSRELLLGRRWKQRLARQTDLAGIRLDADDLHFDLVADLEEIGHLADARVRHLGDVQQSVLTRQDLDECSVRFDALDGAFVIRADLRRGREALDDLDRAIRRCDIHRGDRHLAVIIDIDLRSGLFDDPADRLAARADDVADAILRLHDRVEARRELGELRLRLRDHRVHLVEDVH